MAMRPDLGDWRPSRFRSELWGCSAGIDFPVVKLLDYASSEEVLAADTNRLPHWS